MGGGYSRETCMVGMLNPVVPGDTWVGSKGVLYCEWQRLEWQKTI